MFEQFARRGAVFGACLLMTAGTIPPAQGADTEIEALRAEIARLAERLNALEARSSSAVQPAPEPPATRQKAASGLKINGNFRYRYEFIDAEGRPERNRNRLRARVGIAGKVNDTVKAGIQLASGGDNPTSTNQTLDDGFTTKDFGLDLAYVTWAAAANTSITAGKMKNPFHRVGSNGLVWDGDVNPEGVALNFDNGAVFANLAGLYVEERSASDDSLILGGQLGMNVGFENNIDAKVGVGYFAYTNTRGNSPFYDGSARGNSVDAEGKLVNDYRQLELFGELGTQLGDMPIKLFADWVQNTEADQLDTGYAFGVKLGKAAAPGTWDAAWIYQEVERDAVIGTFNDSDFGGGGTDVKGHILKANYSVAKNWTAALTYFLNEIDENIGAEKDYQRLQADLQFKF